MTNIEGWNDQRAEQLYTEHMLEYTRNGTLQAYLRGLRVRLFARHLDEPQNTSEAKIKAARIEKVHQVTGAELVIAPTIASADGRSALSLSRVDTTTGERMPGSTVVMYKGPEPLKIEGNGVLSLPKAAGQLLLEHISILEQAGLTPRMAFADTEW